MTMVGIAWRVVCYHGQDGTCRSVFDFLALSVLGTSGGVLFRFALRSYSTRASVSSISSAFVASVNRAV